MATQTPNYGLPKPDGSDVPDISVFGTAMDKIDTQMKASADNIGLLPTGMRGTTQGAAPVYTPKNWTAPVLLMIGLPGTSNNGLYLCIRGNITTLSAATDVTVTQLDISPGTVTAVVNGSANMSYTFLSF